MKFPQRLKELREEMKFSQAELAQRIGVSPGAIGNYESGTRTPRLDDLEMFADYFNVPMDYLVGRTNERPKFTLEEEWLIRCYREADADTQTGIKAILRKFDARDTVFKVG